MSKQIKPQQKAESEQNQVSKQVHTETKPLQTAVSDPYIPALQRAYANPSNITPNDVRVLQRTIGNQAMRRLVIQRKMTVEPVGDKYEQEADSVAKQVVGKINDPQQDVAQRQEEDEDIQMKPSSTMSGGELASDVEGQIQSAKGGGRSLDSNTQSSMGQAFNADFSGVNIHTNDQSDTLNRSLQARAFTSGQDIFFRSGEYSPNSSGGQELLAHELTHVVQQNGRGNVQRQPETAGTTAGVSVNETAPNSLVSLKKHKTHLDFIRVKKKDTYIAKMMLNKVGLAKEPDDAYGHWWIEIGDKTGGASQKVGTWTPVESYGWWPDKKNLSIKETLKGVGGVLNRGEGQDPHHGDEAESEYHPVKMVDDQDDYDTVRNEVVNEVRQFANGFKGSWNWRFGWGKNCHTFLDRLKKKTHLHHQQGSRWLLRPDGTESLENTHRAEHLNEIVLAAVKGADIEGIGDTFIETIDDGTLSWSIGLDVDDYLEIDAETREEVLAYLDVSAEAMNNRLRMEFGEEMTDDIF